ncbi:hypothetical protein ACJX0J_014552, partial [Zea mays]
KQEQKIHIGAYKMNLINFTMNLLPQQNPGPIAFTTDKHPVLLDLTFTLCIFILYPKLFSHVFKHNPQNAIYPMQMPLLSNIDGLCSCHTSGNQYPEKKHPEVTNRKEGNIQYCLFTCQFTSICFIIFCRESRRAITKWKLTHKLYWTSIGLFSAFINRNT